MASSVTENTLAGNPHLWVALYGITSPYFATAVAMGALNDYGRGGQRVEAWEQAPLLPEVQPVRAMIATAAPVAYRSRAPNRVDVMVEDRASRKARRMLGISLRRERVLRA